MKSANDQKIPIATTRWKNKHYSNTVIHLVAKITHCVNFLVLWLKADYFGSQVDSSRLWFILITKRTPNSCKFSKETGLEIHRPMSQNSRLSKSAKFSTNKLLLYTKNCQTCLLEPFFLNKNWWGAIASAAIDKSKFKVFSM